VVALLREDLDGRPDDPLPDLLLLGR
jgi:hypothetical protein